MKKILYTVISISLMLLTSCDVHQWPETPELVKCHLRLSYQTQMTEWEHLYNGSSVTEQGTGDTYDNRRENGKIRYIIRAYPVSEKMRTASDYTQQFEFTRDINKGYDHQVTLDILPGNYNIMVWSDLVQKEGDDHFHDAGNFAEIRLQGEHKGNNDYRDAFRGTGNITLEASIKEQKTDTLEITMQRPLAKFEFITNDVLEFIEKESTRVSSKSNGNKSSSGEDTPTKAVSLDDYRVVFHYVGFMPDAYSMHTDKPVDSSTGVMFESSLKKITDSEASVGFDYVFVNGKESAVTVRIGIYDKEGTQLSLTDPIEVPLKRSNHTIMTGMFLMSQASGGVTINPDFDGDHNLIIP